MINFQQMNTVVNTCRILDRKMVIKVPNVASKILCRLLISNRYELDLLTKPYSEQDIAVLKNKMATYTSGFKRFDDDGFDGKWNIKAINKSEKTIDFWIKMVTVGTGDYNFGRFAEKISFKLNVGVVGFKVQPLRPVFDEKHMMKYQAKMVAFDFKNFVDVKTLIN